MSITATSKCPKCNGLGFVPTGDDGLYRTFEPCECQKKARMDEIWANRNVPSIFADMRLDDFKTRIYSPGNRPQAEKAMNAARKYTTEYGDVMQQVGGRGLYFVSGTKGSGKSMLAAVMVNEFAARGVRAKFIGMAQLLGEIKAAFDPDTKESSAEILDTAMHLPILALDDIGVEKQSQWVDETVYRLIDARLSNKLTTIFTSNVEIRELQYDERTIDRIRRMAYVVRMPEESVREKIAMIEDRRMDTLLGGQK